MKVTMTKWVVMYKNKGALEKLAGKWPQHMFVGVESRDNKKEEYVYASFAVFDTKKEAEKIRDKVKDWIVKKVEITVTL